MISKMIYGIALGLLFGNIVHAQCYIDPFTGLQICPKTNRPILNAIAERPIVQATLPPYFENKGYSIASQASSGGSFGSVVVKSYGSNGGSTGASSPGGGSTGFSGVYSSGGSTGSVSVVRSYSVPVVQSVTFASCICPDCGCVKTQGYQTSAASYSSSTASFASALNASGSLFHDGSYVGPEVVYRSSGIATQADAMRTWRRSPPHRRLLRSGAITEVVCTGNVCVGR